MLFGDAHAPACTAGTCPSEGCELSRCFWCVRVSRRIKQQAATSMMGGHGLVDAVQVLNPGCAQAYKLAASQIIREYFETQDVREAATSLAELQQPEHHDCFVKQVWALPRGLCRPCQRAWWAS